MNDDVRSVVKNFFALYPKVTYPRDQILIFPNQIIEKVYYIIDGRVCQYSISYRGDEIIVNTYKSPAFFPMAMVVNHASSKFFFKTETESVIHAAPVRDVLKFVRTNPHVVYDLLSRVYNGTESVLERMVHLMSGTARSRLIFELLIEFRRFRNKSDESGYLEVNESSIASRSGLSRETVSREMQHLKAKGLVEIKAHKIFIKNVAMLENQLGAHL